MVGYEHMFLKSPQIFKDKEQLPLGVEVIDIVSSALKELFIIENPHLKNSPENLDEQIKDFARKFEEDIIWTYLPWKNIAIRMPSESVYFKLRTARNKNIITEEEQEKYRNIFLGVAGLSVGSSIVNSLVMTGGPKKMKIADFDVLETTNLNRLRGKIFDIGKIKTEIAAREVWELDPFTELELWSEGISKDTVENFILSPKLDIFVDEMDSINLKIASRIICKNNRIPVIMATDNGDSVILDVERFDLEPERAIFHGLLGDFKQKDFESLTFKDWLKIATKIVDAEYLTERMQESLLQIGRVIPSVPQLGTTAAVAGAMVAYAIRQIANGYELPSGRYVLGMESSVSAGYDSEDNVQKRKVKTEEFRKQFHHD